MTITSRLLSIFTLADGVNSVESPGYYAAMKSELDGKYDNGGNIAWSLDFTDFTKSFFRNVIRDHEKEGWISGGSTGSSISQAN